MTASDVYRNCLAATTGALLLAGCIATESTPPPRPSASRAALQPIQSPQGLPPAEPLQPVQPVQPLQPLQPLQPDGAAEPTAQPPMSCEMYRKITRVMTPAEQRIVMQAQTKGMSPQMRAQYLERIRHCK